MATETDIANSALIKIGEKRITEAGFATPTNEREREAAAHYPGMRDAELRKNFWNFSMKRLSLAPDVDAPAFGYSVRYAVPADFLRLHSVFETKTYSLEGGFILCDVSDAIQIRYVRRVTVVNEMDAIFRDVLACRLGIQLCDRLTQARGKKSDVTSEYSAHMAMAASVDAIENPVEEFEEDSWISVRR